MNEAGKTKAIWDPDELSLFRGKGIDIGCGEYPIMPDAKRFDMADGDANDITKYVTETYDYVFSSHCLEHMVNPQAAILGWWHIVAPGGALIVLVPDEDLYEQGSWPSRFNSDHKWTFTISKAKSWSPKSINMLGIYESLQHMFGAIPHSIKLQDHGYNRGLIGIDQTRFGALAQIQMIVRKPI